MVRPDVSRRQSSRVGPPSFFHFYADSKRQNSALAFGYERNSGWTVVFEPCRKRFGWPLWGCRSTFTIDRKPAARKTLIMTESLGPFLPWKVR